ncbi:CobW family GTP-binding protein [Mahella australiensis]|uniref:Cobalamin synthesis protein P47K n=1 Tax=Mahella australiensis (strain DSM 15567 / CIP 107919 / 50-1 BON) TaxID=697281 RepID=F3ZWJ4_MAHA5|nr:GTP-binding protein [Mahella australiensis]AEE95429.1 cobalamin synthesis protein P47K [Mahella australiensis 50-1 BON]
MSKEHSKKVYLITGFLGAGKTTLIKNIIEAHPDIKIGVIVNEFGKVGVDGSVIGKDGMAVHEITNGSIFCSCLQATFAQSLIEFSGLPIDILLIEGSGMADPSNVDAILESIKDKTHAPLSYKGDICVVDAANIDKLVRVSQPAEKQIKYADYIIINKADKVDEHKIEVIKRLMAELNPYAAIEVTSFSSVNGDILDKIQAFDKEGAELKQSCNTPSNRPTVIYMKSQNSVEEGAFKRFMNSIIGDAFRVKGFFKLNGDWKHIDGTTDEFTIKPINVEREISELVIFPKADEHSVQNIKQKCEEFLHAAIK